RLLQASGRGPDGQRAGGRRHVPAARKFAGRALVQFFCRGGRALLSREHQDATLGEGFHPDPGGGFDPSLTQCPSLQHPTRRYGTGCSEPIAMPIRSPRAAAFRATTNGSLAACCCCATPTKTRVLAMAGGRTPLRTNCHLKSDRREERKRGKRGNDTSRG